MSFLRKPEARTLPYSPLGRGRGWVGIFPQQVEVNVANAVKQTLLRGTKQSPSQGSHRRLRREAIRRPRELEG